MHVDKLQHLCWQEAWANRNLALNVLMAYLTACYELPFTGEVSKERLILSVGATMSKALTRIISVYVTGLLTAFRGRVNW